MDLSWTSSITTWVKEGRSCPVCTSLMDKGGEGTERLSQDMTYEK